MSFRGIKIITLSEGKISSLHIGLKGTMNAIFLKDLADKTRRGLRGKLEKGKSGGGVSDGSRREASHLLRTLVDKIVLTKKNDKQGLSIDLYGRLAGILNLATKKKELAGSQMLERLQVLPINDNNAEAFQKTNWLRGEDLNL